MRDPMPDPMPNPMPDALRHLHTAVAAWFARAQASGWLDSAAVQSLQRLEHGTPADLFAADPQAGTQRPLVVAFFGGTGVGKSSLINRLAGAPIARVGVERPTSHEVTMYVHEAVALADLPAELPLEQVQITRHADATRRDVLWLDMPDIDSTEQRNRTLALAWLAHVDLLIYVVSPERYRDDAGWRVLQARGQRHGWLFVMNHWDEGAPEQLQDLRELLRRDGFADPVILPTCCAPDNGAGRCADDQFDALETTIGDLQAQHGQEELERLGRHARLQDLGDAVRDALEQCGTPDTWGALQPGFNARWTRTTEELRAGLDWPIREIAAEFAARDAHLLTRLLDARAARRSAEQSAPATGGADGERRAVETLWDEWANAKLQGIADQTEIALRSAGIRPQPLLGRLQPQLEQAAAHLRPRLQDALRQGLARPGTPWQRSLHRITGAATALLPITALAWVAYHIVRGFLQGTTGAGAFLGSDFAINSILLVGSAWLLPWLLHRRLRPSVEKSVVRALHSGVVAGLEEVKAAVDAAFAEAEAEREDLLTAARGLLQELAAAAGGAVRPNPILARLLPVTGHNV
ncbi:MAG: GTPase domain-containing protein [Gammaproteobacteria bacterium]|nr:GTPase domain-containing protein [Gammaproteobacteria bacterium]